MSPHVDNAPITAEAFTELTRPFVGLSVRASKGYGTAMLLDFGPSILDRHGHLTGALSALIEWDWRIEGRRSILLSSGSAGRRGLENGIARLDEAVVSDVWTEGRLPEVCVGFSDGRLVRSTSLYTGQPGWTLFLDNEAETWLCVRRGRIVREWRRDHPPQEFDPAKPACA